MTWVLKTKPATIAPYYSGYQVPPPCLISYFTTITNSTTTPCNKFRTGHQPGKAALHNIPRKRYATVSGASGSGSGRDKPTSSSRGRQPRHHHDQWPVSAHPTPYDIFDQQRGAPYSKARFYELVKVYHPDRHRHSDNDNNTSNNPSFLSNQVRLERYRMIVRANEILCDPSKRRAYDLFGLGWEEHHHDPSQSWDSEEDRFHRRQASRAWRSEPGNPSMNATWEDWERWYQQQSGSEKNEKQKPVYMSNEFFVATLCLFVVIGSVGQARRAATNSASIMELRDGQHREIHSDYSKKQRELAALNRTERVETFLRQREGWHVGSSVPSDWGGGEKAQQGEGAEERGGREGGG